MPKTPVNAALGRCKVPVALPWSQRSFSPSRRPLHASAIQREDTPTARAPSRNLVLNQKNFQGVETLFNERRQSNIRPTQSFGPSSRSLVLDRNAPPSGVVDARNLAARPNPNNQPLRPTQFGYRNGVRSSVVRTVSYPDRPQRFSRPGDNTRGAPTRGSRGRGGLRRGRGRGGPPDRSRGQTGEKHDRLQGGMEEDEDDSWERFVSMSSEDLEALTLECVRAERGGAKKYPEPEEFSVSDVNAKTLGGHGPAVALGQWGMTEIVEDRIDRITGDGLIDEEIRVQELARRLTGGEFVRFRDEAEKEATLALARDLAEREAGRKMDETGEIVEATETAFEPIGKEGRDSITGQLLSGSYKMAEKEPGFVQELMIKLRRNETVGPKQEAVMARKIRSLMPAQKVVRPPKKTANASTL